MAIGWKPPTEQRTLEQEDRPRAAGRRSLSGREWLEGIRDGAVPPPPAAVLLGLQVERVEDGEVVFSMRPAEYQYNPAGTVHGGIITTLADTAMTTSVMSNMPAGSWAPTIEIKVNFIKPITEATGLVYAIGRVIHLGGSTAVAEARVIDSDGVLYAHATSTCALKRGDA